MIAMGLLLMFLPLGFGLSTHGHLSLSPAYIALFACFLSLFILVYGAAWYANLLRATHPEEYREQPPDSPGTFSEKVGEPALRLAAIYSGPCAFVGIVRLAVIRDWSVFFGWILPWSLIGMVAWVGTSFLVKRRTGK